jgi:uncharacterized protein YfaQ (DUF2300 family)
MRSPLRSLCFSTRLASSWMLFITAACTTFRPVQPDQLTPPQSPARVWVTRGDRSVAVLDSARVEGDSLVGIVNGTAERLPLTGATIQTRQLSIGRTAALAGAVAVALTVYLLDKGAAPQAFVCPPAMSAPCVDCNTQRSVWCESLR